jgi:lysyl-tRNA synthetase class 2
MAPDGGMQTRYLHTSPELACKKLLAAGEEKIFFLGPVFRNGERGPRHAPEFTMLEWYRAGAGYETVMADAIALARAAARTVETSALRFACDEPERLSVAEAFRRYASINLDESLSADGVGDRTIFARQAERCGLTVRPDDSWSDIFSLVISRIIEPKLGAQRLALLHDYPLPEASNARLCAHDPRFAERFELYAMGIELANGFGELSDVALQRQRFLAAMDEKERLYGERYPIDEDFLAALDIMPEASGCALGFDRLVMLATGARHIDDVIWTP